MSTSSTSSSPHWRSWRPYWRRHLLLFVASTSSSSSSFSPSFGHFRGLCALWFKTAMNRDVGTGPLARPFAHTAHLFACFRLLALLAPSAALTRLVARSLRSLPRSWESEFSISQNDLVLSHSAASSSLSSSHRLFGGFFWSGFLAILLLILLSFMALLGIFGRRFLRHLPKFPSSSSSSWHRRHRFSRHCFHAVCLPYPLDFRGVFPHHLLLHVAAASPVSPPRHRLLDVVLDAITPSFPGYPLMSW